MKTYLKSNNSDKLLLFFCGWGMDKTPFNPLNCDSDILFVYDYTTCDFEYDFSKYKDIKLLAFSYGVYACSIVNLPKLSRKVAINGTLIPVDDEYGVPFKKFELTEKMDSQSVVKFRQRLFGGVEAENHFEIFEQNLPERSAKSCTDELIGMKKYVPDFGMSALEFDKVFVSEYDKCVPTKNQKKFWLQKCPTKIELLPFGHFVFYNYKNFAEFFNK